MIGLATGGLTGALLAAIWQGILLAALAGLGLRLLPKTPAAVRFAIWFGVFLVVTALPLASLWPPAAEASATGGGHGAWLTLDARWSLAIGLVWLAASLVRAVTLVVAGFRVRALWKRAVPLSMGQDVFPSSAASNVGHPNSLPMRRAQLCVSDEVDRPTVIGFFAPKILIPAWLLEKLSAAELEQIVLHETGHLGRADDWMNLLQKIALMLFPLNPALAWVERRLCFERELAVDERVLRAFAGKAGAAKAYASCLATLAEHRLGRRGVALAIGALGRESELGRRVGRILRRGELMRPVQAKLVMVGAMLGLLGASAGLERCPQVIGFAPPGVTQTVGLADARTDAALPNGFGYRAVNYRQVQHNNNSLPNKTNGMHESLLKAVVSVPGRREMEVQPMKEQAAGGRFGVHATLLRASAERSDSKSESEQDVADGPSATVSSGSRMHTVSMAPRAKGSANTEAGDGVVRWVVVASWQGADGSQMVMTTEETQVSSSGTARTTSDSEAAQPSQPVHPYYAAVPVRDGWLVFQL